MKKIVALVLCLVLALSLCTVAFAETGEGYTLVKLDVAGGIPTGTPVAMDKDDTITVTKTASSTTTVDGKSTTTVYADKYVITGTTMDDTFYQCDDSIATHRLIKGSTVISLSNDTTVDLSKGVTKVVTSKIAAKTGTLTCTDIAGGAAAFVIGGKYYTVGGDQLALLNGKVVTYGTELFTVGHKLTKDPGKATATYNAKGEPVSVACGVCKASFAVVKAADVPASYTKVPVNFSTLGFDAVTGTFYVLETVAASDTAVDSPKTFDAGIALYAGMALMSVAGSAVVIGKKEF